MFSCHTCKALLLAPRYTRLKAPTLIPRRQQHHFPPQIPSLYDCHACKAQPCEQDCMRHSPPLHSRSWSEL